MRNFIISFCKFVKFVVYSAKFHHISRIMLNLKRKWPIINKSLKIKTEDKIPVKKNNNNVKSAETPIKYKI